LFIFVKGLISLSLLWFSGTSEVREEGIGSSTPEARDNTIGSLPSHQCSCSLGTPNKVNHKAALLKIIIIKKNPG
jgi:hypothetical protein